METADGTGKSKRFTTWILATYTKKRTENERIIPGKMA
jgi:hypothetical protein